MRCQNIFSTSFKKANNPENPGAYSFSFEAVLHADKITIFALIFKLETSDADKIPSFFIVVFDGGVNTKMVH